jgi:hypothetical protein
MADGNSFNFGCPFNVTRRDFLAAAGITGLSAAGLGASALAETASQSPPAAEKAKVRLIFSHVSGEKPC